MRTNIITRPRTALAAGALTACSGAVVVAGGVAHASYTLRHAPLAPAAPQVAVDVSEHVSRGSLLLGGSTTLAGSVAPATDRAPLSLLERRGHRWIYAGHAVTDAAGRYRVRVQPWRLGANELRIRFDGDTAGPATRGRVVTVGAFHLAGASWYGPGGQLACGGWLTDSTLGVANKTLPCGTLVTLRLGRRSVRVPVIDRGPYVPGRSYDLTPATRRALGFGDVGEIWASA